MTSCVITLLWIALALLPAPRGRGAYFYAAASVGGGTPIAFAALGSAASTTAASTYATGSYTPTANALVIAIVVNTIGTTPPGTCTFSGNGLTWVEITNTTANSIANPLTRITVFRAMGASPSAGAGTATFGGNQTGGIVRVVEFQNVDTTGTNGSGAIVQSKTNQVDTPSPANTAYITADAAIADPDNAAFVAFGLRDEAPNVSDEAGWTEDTEFGYATPGTGLSCLYQLTATANTIEVTTDTSEPFGAVFVEVKAP